MTLNIIAVFLIGISLAGVGYALSKTFGWTKSLMMPIFAGAGMLAYVTWNDYSWYSRTAGQLPDYFQVVKTYKYRSIFYPWTYLVPNTNRYVAMNIGEAQSHAKAPHMKIIDTYFIVRNQGTEVVPILFDCVAGQQALVTHEVKFAADGTVANAHWGEADADFLGAACRE